MTHRLLPITEKSNILKNYKGTPIEKLLEYHNLNQPYEIYQKAQLLAVMCIDSRKSLRIPDNFAFIVRAGGANLMDSPFKLTFSSIMGELNTVALIAHTQCGMVGLDKKRQTIIDGLVDRFKWDPKKAEAHFDENVKRFGITNEIDFVLDEAKQVRKLYPGMLVAPLLYKVEDNLLYQIKED